MPIYCPPPTPDEIYHYGVIGMKWGVRRYQNYDGTYTQRGLKRYNISKEKYDSAKAKKNEAYNKLKNSEKLYKKAEHEKYKSAKSEYKSAKKQMNSDYNKLKYDKRADKGKELYKKGYTITEGANVASKITGAGSVSSVIGLRLIKSHNDIFNYPVDGKDLDQKIGIGMIVVGGILTGTGIGTDIRNRSRNKNLRAYYAHN